MILAIQLMNAKVALLQLDCNGTGHFIQWPQFHLHEAAMVLYSLSNIIVINGI